MSWVQREAGRVVGVFASQQEGSAEEELPDDHPDVLAYLNPPPATPESVTAAQLIRALDQMGLLGAVEAAAAQAGGLTLKLWNRAPNFHRDDPLIAGVAAAINKTSADVDELFILAATFT